MSARDLGLILRHVCRATGASDGADATDADLLARFVRRREEAAFAAVLARHGPLVLGVCRRVLGDAHDAEDAFQATFLVLARRAGSVRRGAALSSWLYGVAYRVSLEARKRLARRRRHERQAAARPRDESPADGSCADLRRILDEELSRLPEKYRGPLVLHYLEGKTKEEAARQLGWSEGTVSGRLDRARKLLRERLARRGVTLGAAALGTALSQHTAGGAVPAALRETALRVALGGAAAPQAVGLAESVLRVLVLARLRVGVALIFLTAVLATGTGLAARSFRRARPADPAREIAGPPLAQKVEPPAGDADPPPAADEDPNAPAPRDRAADRLVAVLPDDWEASWKQDLNATGQPAGEVLRRLLRPWGLTVEAAPALDRPVHLSLRGRPRLELIEEVCRAAGVYPVYPDGTARSNGWDRTVRLKAEPRPQPIAFAGPGTRPISMRTLSAGWLALRDECSALGRRFAPRRGEDRGQELKHGDRLRFTGRGRTKGYRAGNTGTAPEGPAAHDGAGAVSVGMATDKGGPLKPPNLADRGCGPIAEQAAGTEDVTIEGR